MRDVIYSLRPTNCLWAGWKLEHQEIKLKAFSIQFVAYIMKKRTSFELYQLDSAVMVHFKIISLCPFNLREFILKCLMIIYKSSSAHVLSSRPWRGRNKRPIVGKICPCRASEDHHSFRPSSATDRWRPEVRHFGFLKSLKWRSEQRERPRRPCSPTRMSPWMDGRDNSS